MPSGGGRLYPRDRSGGHGLVADARTRGDRLWPKNRPSIAGKHHALQVGRPRRRGCRTGSQVAAIGSQSTPRHAVAVLRWRWRPFEIDPRRGQIRRTTKNTG